MKRNAKRYGELFFSTLRLSACTFGGGFVIVPLMQKRFVAELNWIDEREMLDLVAVAQSSPGPIVVNAALMVGYRIGGVPGALLAALGTVLPPLFIISVISFFYQQFRANPYVNAVMKEMQAGVGAVICHVVLDMGERVWKMGGLVSALLMAAVFVAVYFFRVNIVLVILCCGAAGYIAGVIRRRRQAASPSEEGRERP